MGDLVLLVGNGEAPAGRKIVTRVETARRGHYFIWSQNRLKMLHLLFPWLLSFILSVSTLGKVLFRSLRAENYSHTNPTLLKSQVQLSLAAGSGQEKHVMHAWLSWKKATDSGACL